MHELTELLNSSRLAEPQKAEAIIPLMYEELRRLAVAKMAGQPPGHTLQATALVHEAYLRMIKQKNPQWESRNHFYAAAAETMRRILVDQARRKLSKKRGGDLERSSQFDYEIAMPEKDERLILVSDALEYLEAEDRMKAQIVKLKYYVGLTSQEIASLLDVSEKTVRRHWNQAKVWLYERISEPSSKKVDD